MKTKLEELFLNKFDCYTQKIEHEGLTDDIVEEPAMTKACFVKIVQEFINDINKKKITYHEINPIIFK